MEKEIGKIPKNDTTNIVIRIDDFADKRGLTIREFVESERYTGFTKSGVRILAKDWADFKKMINSITDEEMKDIVAEAQEEEQKTLDEPTNGPSDEEIGDM